MYSQITELMASWTGTFSLFVMLTFGKEAMLMRIFHNSIFNVKAWIYTDEWLFIRIEVFQLFD